MGKEDEDSPEMKDENADTYLITLGELTEYETAEWLFPDTTRCPMRSCSLKFRTRTIAMSHYRDNHAKHAVLCKICDYPLMLLTGIHHLDGHYARKHPEEELPLRVNTSRHQCSICQTSFKNYVYLNNHLKKFHKGRKRGKKITENGDEKAPKIRKSRLTSNTFGKVDGSRERSRSRSSEWIDMDSNSSIDSDTCETLNEASIDSSDQKTETGKSDDSLKHLVKRKASSFKRRGLRPCTICGRNLRNYTLACNHYRKLHGRTVSMCPFCKTYFSKSTALLKHMIAYHQYSGPKKSSKFSIRENDPIAAISKRYYAKNKKKQDSSKELERLVLDAVRAKPNDEPLRNFSSITTTNEFNTNEQPDESAEIPPDTDGDEFVTLGEFTEYPTIQWRFPQITSCPRKNCKEKFNNRAETIAHYREVHAKYDVLCNECNTIVAVSGSQNMLNHYKRRHSDIEPPVKTDENRADCPFCEKTMSFTQLRIHMNNVHNGSEKIETEVKKNSDRTKKRTGSLNMLRTINEEKSYPKSQRASLRSKSVSIIRIDKSAVSSRLVANNLLQKSMVSTASKKTEETHPIDDQPEADPPSELVYKKVLKTASNLSEQSSLDSSTGESKMSTKQKTRSTGVRNKACTICGISLINYIFACDHYNRNHGRNVLMCPYCGQYFLQAQTLTKHVLANHSNESATGDKVIETPIIQTTNNVQNTHDNNEVELEHLVSDPVPEFTIALTEEYAQSNFEPLNLSMKNKNQVSSDSGVVDLSSGALDLSIRK